MKRSDNVAQCNGLTPTRGEPPASGGTGGSPGAATLEAAGATSVDKHKAAYLPEATIKKMSRSRADLQASNNTGAAVDWGAAGLNGANGSEVFHRANGSAMREAATQDRAADREEEGQRQYA